MPKYVVRFHTQVEVSVTLDAEDEDYAMENAHPIAAEYLRTVYGNARDVIASADLDGVGATEAELVEAAVTTTNGS